jgi:hypothetical protein
MESRAGISVDNGGCDTIHTRGYYTNMGKVQIQPRSPKCAISLDRTPTVVGGKLEHFGNITDMICQWEGMEGEEMGAGDHLLNERGRKKRISKVIRQLSGRFEEGVGNHESQPGGRGSGGREEISSITSFSKLFNLENKSESFSISSSNNRISTNSISRISRSNSILYGTNQSGESAVGRKRKAFWRENNPATKKSKMEGVQLGK